MLNYVTKITSIIFFQSFQNLFLAEGRYIGKIMSYSYRFKYIFLLITYQKDRIYIPSPSFNAMYCFYAVNTSYTALTNTHQHFLHVNTPE